MTHPVPDPHERELLETDRTLTTSEIEILQRLGQQSWQQVGRLLDTQAKITYAMADLDDFALCVREHLVGDQHDELVTADLFTCPVCGRLLKDRRSPVASSILLERRRLADLWLGVEQATDDEDRIEAARRFRRALGL